MGERKATEAVSSHRHGRALSNRDTARCSSHCGLRSIMPLPGEWSMAPASYGRFCDQHQQISGEINAKRDAGSSQLSDRLSHRFSSSSTAARGIEYAHWKGPGMQKGPLAAAAGYVWEGSRSLVRPQTDASTYSQRTEQIFNAEPPKPFRAQAEETFNSADIPLRMSVTKGVSDVPRKAYTGPESMPSFEQWVLTQPLGRQMLSDPPDIVEQHFAAYARHQAYMISVSGGEAGLGVSEPKSPRKDGQRPDSRTWKYADLQKQGVRMRPCHGDIPAWGPKEYETTAELHGSRLWPDVSVVGPETLRPTSTPWAAVDLGTARMPVASERHRLRNADVRLAVPQRSETLGNSQMSSHLLSINRHVDHHAELTSNHSGGNTPFFQSHSTRAKILPRNGLCRGRKIF